MFAYDGPCLKLTGGGGGDNIWGVESADDDCDSSERIKRSDPLDLADREEETFGQGMSL